ncbi:hypothetical protein OG909_31205 [Streptomyces sp. NBC_01754]|uniref:hypothetical protein n=1 Tax=Streptomyces sp. NBC_01754 TaxID=2975930 RepID=UPI002DD9E0E9|nr:hypothetical protein [Streptomyces sp. NBC_01754]WSC96416.1 hypothetical protein OG909_31205 [Streptomyces sp. NBC_01754]
MDLTDLLVRAAAARPRVLLVTTPGGTQARLAAEKELRYRDWPTASTPAGADLLLVVGPDCAELGPALERLWEDMPRPRVRLRAETAQDVPPVLDTGRARPATSSGRRRGTDDSRHAGHGGGGAEMPGGPSTAERGEDRDGLALDRLHMSLGPCLADWPAGLRIHVLLQGDVIQRARLGEPHAGGRAEPFWARPWVRAAAGEPVPVSEAARRRAAAHLDSLGRLLSVAGWPAEAVAARRLRDDLLERAPAKAVLPRAVRLARRVGRSRTFFRLTCGIGTVSAADARAAGMSGPAARAGGDVPARYRQWLTEVVDDVRRLDDTTLLRPTARESPRGRWDAERPPSAALAGLLPRLLEGAELGAARLVVASLDPDPDELAVSSPEVERG